MYSPSLNFSMPSTTDISNYVSTKLWFKYPENNYQVWEEQMRCMLDSHGLLGFIDDSALPPTNGDKPVQVMSRDCMMWRRRSDVLVKGWILSACSDDVLSSVATLQTAKDVWLELKKMSKYQLSIDPSALWANAQSRALKDLNPAKYLPLAVYQDASGCEWGRYLPLQRAVIQGDWDKTIQIFSNDVEAIKAGLDGFKSRALHIAVGTGKIEFFKKLVALMPDETIAQQTDNGDTALSIAAALGNEEAATVLVKRMPRLLYVSNNQKDFPVQTAAKYARKAVLDYLISATDFLCYDGENPRAESAWLRLLVYVIDAEFFDIACNLVEKYPCLAKLKLPNNDSALKKLAEKKWAVSRRDAVVSKLDRLILFVYRKSPEWLWKRMEELLPAKVSRIKDVQLPPNRAKELVVKLCNGLQYNLSQEKALEIYYDAILMATQSGATYVVEKIKETFPGAIYSSMDAHISIVHVAIQNRSLDVLKLIHENNCHRHLYSDWVDFEGNNLLHLAAKLTPALKIKAHPVAAFQMQSELKWYEEIEALIHPGCTNRLNNAGKTPWMVFREEHMNMKVDGEKWLKDTSSSYTIVSALIATVTFAAVVTVPGGTNDESEGFPVFSKRLGFFIFAISDILSLCFSVTSLLIFLVMLTTQHTYEAFLTFHPYLIQGGIGSLFISVVTMMVAFVAAAYLVFRNHSIWIPIVATILAAYPVLIFLASHGQLLPLMRSYAWLSLLIFLTTRQIYFHLSVTFTMISFAAIYYLVFEEKQDTGSHSGGFLRSLPSSYILAVQIRVLAPFII